MRAIIVSDVRLYREGLAAALRKDGRVEVVCTAEDAEEALAAVARHLPSTALLDVQLTGATKTIRTLVKRFPTLKVVVLGLSEAERDVVMFAEAGIAGYISRGGSLEELVRTMTDARQEKFGCSQRVAAALLKRVHRLATAPLPATASLTPREQQIGELLREGLTNKEISKRLCIEVATVKNHVHNVLDKLGAGSRGEAAAMIGGRVRPRPAAYRV